VFVDQINWRGVDLNLLLTFNAIMTHGSVSAASEFLCVGQPATSYNLKRLRILLGDPLFERQGNLMVPTQRAIELGPKVKLVLDIIRDDILAPQSFVPAQFDGQVCIGLCDYAEQVFGPDIFDHLRAQAPHCKIIFQPVDSENVEQALESNQVDVAIGVFKDQPASLKRNFLYRERHLCMFDNSQMQVKLPISLEDYLATPQMVITANRELGTPVDITLKKMEQARSVVLGSTRFLTLKRMLPGRHLLAVVAEMVGRSELGDDQLTLCEPPIDIADFDIDMLTRKRDQTHPQMKWLNSEVQSVIQAKVDQLKGN
jgi:DNA-binding transcriptional LysR family regulator